MSNRKIDPEQKMGQVITAARSLFVRKGYHNVSIPMIVKESGVSTGAIYHYFSNKEDLARSIHDQTLGEFQRGFNARLNDAMSCAEKLHCFADLVFEITENDPEVMEYMLFMKHGEFLSEAYPICSTEPFRKVQQIIAAGIENGELRPGDFLLSSISYTGVILRAAELRLQGVIQGSLWELSAELIDNAWAAIKA